MLLLTQVRARPLATLERDRETLLLWFDPSHAAAPVAPVASDTLPQVTLGAPVDAGDAPSELDGEGFDDQSALATDEAPKP